MSDSESPTFAVLSLDALGVRLALRCDDTDTLGMVRSSLGSFETEESAESITIEARVQAQPPYAEVSGERRELDPRHAPEQVFGLVMSGLLENTKEYVVLHGAGVEIDGRAFIFSGPSGSGKTTLALALAGRGRPLLSDDFIPIHRESLLAHPFPKSINVRPGRSTDLAEALVPAWAPKANDGRLTLGADRWVQEPLPLGGVVLFDGDPTPPTPTDAYCLSIRHSSRGDEMAQALRKIPGISVLEHEDDDLAIRIDPKKQPRAELNSFLHRFGDSILEYSLISAGPLCTDASPETQPLAGSTALMLMLREVQNRHETGALSASVGGDMTRIASEVAAAFADCPCAWLMPGTPEATAEHLENLFKNWARTA